MTSLAKTSSHRDLASLAPRSNNNQSSHYRARSTPHAQLPPPPSSDYPQSHHASRERRYESPQRTTITALPTMTTCLHRLPFLTPEGAVPLIAHGGSPRNDESVRESMLFDSLLTTQKARAEAGLPLNEPYTPCIACNNAIAQRPYSPTVRTTQRLPSGSPPGSPRGGGRGAYSSGEGSRPSSIASNSSSHSRKIFSLTPIDTMTPAPPIIQLARYPSNNSSASDDDEYPTNKAASKGRSRNGNGRTASAPVPVIAKPKPKPELRKIKKNFSLPPSSQEGSTHGHGTKILRLSSLTRKSAGRSERD